MNAKPKLNNVVIVGNNLIESVKKIKKIQSKILISKKENIEVEMGMEMEMEMEMGMGGVKIEEPICIINKGTGAGGANTNYFGKKFEDKTNNQINLLNDGYIKNSFTKNAKNTYDFYLSKTFEDKTIIFVLQNGFKMYMKNKYNIDLFRCPDEAYIIEYNTGKKVIKILEKKEQNVSGSVETKLWASPSLKREYELVLGNNFEVHYGVCVNDFFKKKLISNEKKYTILNTIFNENNIVVLFGDDENYFEIFNNWFNNSL